MFSETQSQKAPSFLFLPSFFHHLFQGKSAALWEHVERSSKQASCNSHMSELRIRPSAPVKASDDSIWPISWLQAHPISSWQIDGETMETVTDFIILGSKITSGGDCSHEIKRRLLLGSQVMTTQTAYSKAETSIHYHAWMWELDYKDVRVGL